MSLASKLLSASGGLDKLFVDDCFSCYTYTGNGATQTISNGIDLAGKGGLVWTKARSADGHNVLIDTVRGVNTGILTNATVGNQAFSNALTAFTFSGYSLGSDVSGNVNQSGAAHISWTFRKAPKFFDIVTYTGNGLSTQTLFHALGDIPGMVTVKATSAVGNWTVHHRSATGNLYLNTTAAQDTINGVIIGTGTGTFAVAGVANTSGVTYVAYLFAHDPSADGIIQCGSFTTDASGNATVALGWEPQYLMFKRTDFGRDWEILDTSRKLSMSGTLSLYANLSSAEAGTAIANPTATGLVFPASLQASGTYIYLAIRRPNKPPTVGTQVYNPIGYTATNTQNRTISGAGFSPDMAIGHPRMPSGGVGHFSYSRLTNRAINTASTAAESNYSPEGTFTQDGMITDGATGWMNEGTTARQLHFFKRAPGFLDVVAYTGTGSTGQVVNHSLGVVPEIVIIKTRSIAQHWAVISSDGSKYLLLNTTDAQSSYQILNRSASAISFIEGSTGFSNNGVTHVAYLFATLPGISKVGSYVGNGTTQTIPCGFTTGARFCLIKRTDAAGDWFVFDTVRGIISANDPHLSLNTTAAEVTTDDSVDPDVSGFLVNQLAATNINVSAGTYIFLAIS